MGIALLELGRLQEATEILSQLVVAHPKSAAGWAHLARAIAPRGYAWEAHDAIARALKARPDAQTLVVISMLQMTLLHDFDAAEKTARRAVAMSPDHVGALIQHGQALAAQGHEHKAAALLQAALDKEPGNAMAAFFLEALRGPEESALVSAPASAGAPPEYVRGLFDGFADRFDELMVGTLNYRTPRMMDRLLTQWLQKNRSEPMKPMQMMDAGCGTGLCGIWLARYRGRLTGVDLSRRMLLEAKERLVYDELIAADIVEELRKRPASLGLIAAADVMVYFGDLSSFFSAASAALQENGLLLFSVESTTAGDYVLLPTRRFAHSLNYLIRLATLSGLAARVADESVLRLEKGAEVNGRIVLMEKCGT